MNWLKDLISPAVLLFLDNLEFLVVVIIVSFVIWSVPSRHQRHGERSRQLELRLTQELQLRPRQRQRRRQHIEYVSQEVPISSTSEQPKFDSALCENCHKFFRLQRHDSGLSGTAFPHSETLSVLRQNANNGCSVCALIGRKLKDRPVVADEPVIFIIEFLGFSWRVSSPYMEFQVIPVTDRTSKNSPFPLLHLSGRTEHITNAPDCYRPYNAS